MIGGREIMAPGDERIGLVVGCPVDDDGFHAVVSGVVEIGVGIEVAVSGADGKGAEGISETNVYAVRFGAFEVLVLAHFDGVVPRHQVARDLRGGDGE